MKIPGLVPFKAFAGGYACGVILSIQSLPCPRPFDGFRFGERFVGDVQVSALTSTVAQGHGQFPGVDSRDSRFAVPDQQFGQ